MDLELRAPRHHVARRAPLLWAGVALGEAALVAAALLLASEFADDWNAPAWAWALLTVVAVAYAAGMPAIRYRTHRWETTDTAVYTQTGWLTVERRVAPMSRVQTVDLEQGLFSRLLGLASVTVTTASAAGPLRIDGLDRRQAERLVAELTRRADAQPGDAT